MARTRNYKADLEELEEGYEDARNTEFLEQFKDIFYEDNSLNDITEDDIQGFLYSFTFPDVADWCAAEYESRRDSFEDAKYQEFKDERAEAVQQMKDKRMGL